MTAAERHPCSFVLMVGNLPYCLPQQRNVPAVFRRKDEAIEQGQWLRRRDPTVDLKLESDDEHFGFLEQRPIK